MRNVDLEITLRRPLSNATLGRVLIFALATMLLAGGGKTQAVVIPIDLGKTGLSFDTTIPFSDLNGTSLQGQTLSLDLTFTNNEFVRLFTVTTAFAAFVNFQTSGSGLVGFLEGTGFLINDQGNALHAPKDLTSASSGNGEMFAGLFPPALNRPVDFFGVHLDLTFPDNSTIDVTGGELQLRSVGDSGPFGIGPGIPADIVPDIGSTMILLGIALAGLVAMRSRVAPAA
jgi:hypothetical protein